AMRYMAIELTPTTTRGKAQRRKPATSITPWKKASSRQVQPVLKTTHDGVQMRLTSGQTDGSSAPPARMQKTPVRISVWIFSRGAGAERRRPPARTPKIIVAIDGTKLSVVYPPSSSRKNSFFGRGKSWRNQRSKAAAALMCLSQWASNVGLATRYTRPDG